MHLHEEYRLSGRRYTHAGPDNNSSPPRSTAATAGAVTAANSNEEQKRAALSRLTTSLQNTIIGLSGEGRKRRYGGKAKEKTKTFGVCAREFMRPLLPPSAFSIPLVIGTGDTFLKRTRATTNDRLPIETLYKVWRRGGCSSKEACVYPLTQNLGTNAL